MLHKAFFLVHCGSLVSVQGMQALFKGGGNPFSGGMGGLRATKVAIKVKERDETYFFGQRLKTAWGKCYGSPADIEIIRTSIYTGGACQENVIRFGESSLVRKIPDHIQRLGKGEWKVIGVMGPRHGPSTAKTCTQYYSNSNENPAQGYNWTCHWLLVYETKNNGRTTGMFAFDFDSQLGLYVPAKNYFSQSFPRDGGYNESIYFRIFQADQYVQMNKKLAAKNPYWYLNKGTPLAYNKFMSMLV